MNDTLYMIANNETAQGIAVILQGLFLIVGAVLNLIRRK